MKILERGKKLEIHELYEIFSEISSEAVFWLMVSQGSESLNQYILLFYTQYRSAAKISLTGADLLEMGFKAGPVFQDIFRLLRRARLEGRIQSREDEVNFVKKEFSITGLGIDR